MMSLKARLCNKNLSTLGDDFFHAILQDGLSATEVLKIEREWQFTYRSRIVNKNVAGRKKSEFNNERWVNCQGCEGRFKYASGQNHYKRCKELDRNIYKRKAEALPLENNWIKDQLPQGVVSFNIENHPLSPNSRKRLGINYKGHDAIQKVLNVADIKTVKMISKLYLEALISNDKSSSHEPQNVKIFTAQERIYAAQQLAKLVGHPVMQEEMKWKIEILTAILSLTLFEMKQPHGPVKEIPQALSHSAKAETKEIFFRALDVKAKNFETMCSILTSALEYTNDLMKNTKLASPLYPMDEDTVKVWNKVFKTVKKLKMDSKKESKVFQLLFTHMGFQLFLDPEGAQEIINDLYICAEESEKSAKLNEDEPKWVEVVVDSLISSFC